MKGTPLRLHAHQPGSANRALNLPVRRPPALALN
jgi:hypothetical protein